VASGSLPPGAPDDFFARVGEVVDEHGARFVLDTSGDALRKGLEKEGAFLVKPNLRELAGLVEVDTEDLEDPSGYEAAKAEAAQDVVAEGLAEVVVVSMGSAGALLVTEKGVEKLITPTVPIKSRVGAGDSMVAGMVLALTRGKDLYEAGQYGVAAGAAAVMTPGTELCRGDDVECLFKEMKGEA
jgi:6-phosphofructokinase 2